MDKDYYKIMGLTPNATEQEIKTAYRRLARKYHPDISKEPKAEERFKEMGEAYENLRDPEKRRQYDQYLKNKEFHHQSKQGPFHQERSYHSYSPDFDTAEFDSSFFESLFGHARSVNRPMGGHDYQGKVSITLEEAFKGTVKSIQIPSTEGDYTLNVKIPPGVKTGQQIRLAGQGAPGAHGGTKGDLYLTVDIMPHPLFEVKENDIYLTLPITPWEAALGTTVMVPTLSGKIDLKIPPGSQGGQKLRLKNRGLPGTHPGNLYVLLKIITPPAHSAQAQELYKKMAETMPFNPREAMGV